MFNQLILHIKSVHKFSDQDKVVGSDDQNNDILTNDIETNPELTDTVENSGTKNKISYEVMKAMLLDHFENLNKSLSGGFSKTD